MSCNVYFEKLIFSVMVVSRFEPTRKLYVFSGTVTKEISDVFSKLEKRKPIAKEDQKILKDNYANYYTKWIDLIKKSIPIKFINHKIQMDDNLNDIRKKIFVYLSEDNKYLLPKNQELWFEKKDNTYEVIGYNYTDNITKQKIKLVPHIYKKIDKINDVELLLKEDENFFTTCKKNTAENNMLIYDLLTDSEFMSDIIYVSDAMDEKKYLEKKIGYELDKNKSKNYFKKYWPYNDVGFKEKDIKSEFEILKNYYIKEQDLFDLMSTVKINKDYFGKCNIITALFTINGDPYNDDGSEAIEEHIDIFPIFDDLREKKLDEKTPFLKYIDESFDQPFYIISKKAINNNKIDKKTLRNWLGINKEHKKRSGITIKRYLKDYNGIPRYSEIFITNTGKIALNMSFSMESNASFEDIEYVVKDCKKFIEDINKNRITRSGEKEKIDTPDFNYENNKITIKKNTKIMFTNIMIPFISKVVIDFNKLRDFSKNFPYFLIEVPKDVIKKDKELDDNLSFKLKYKRVSGFVNMNDILTEIDKFKQEEKHDNAFIIHYLEKKFQKSYDEIKGYMLEWEKKYSSKKSNISFKKGILISISNNGIMFIGITKIYQIPLLYNFFTFFLSLFFDYDLLIKQKNVKNFFSKNIDYKLNKNSNMINNNTYEDNENIYLNYKNISKNYNSQNETELIDKINDEIDEIDEKETLDNIYNNYVDKTESEYMNNVSSPQIVTARDYKQVHPDLKMKCPQEVVEKGTCKDFCDDEKYFIRRLETYDKVLFSKDRRKKDGKKTEKSEKNTRYSRKCQESESAQPVILAYDPATNEKVKKESYTYSFKHSSDPEKLHRWYVCPKIWCAYCEIPIIEDEIDESTIKVRVSDKGNKKCKVAQCPYGDHLVFVRDSGHYYPGFLKSSKENKLKESCMPCCFKNPHNIEGSKYYTRYKKCLGDEVNNVEVKDDAIYVLGSKSSIIQKDRYANVSKELGRILNSDVESGYLKKNSGYLRKGIKHFENNSFLSCILDVLNSSKNTNITIASLKESLTNKLNEDMFLSLYGGNLVNIFHNPKMRILPINNFKNYINNSNIELTHVYLWDYLQRPGILSKNGVNIYIFKDDHLLCPEGENINTFYNKDRESILISKYGIYYEPIYYLEGTGKSANITFIFNNDNPQINKIFDISKDGCKMKFDIDWLSVLKDNVNKYNFKVDNETLEKGVDIDNIIKNKLIIKLQYVDLYNKVFAVLLENGLYVPISPVKIDNNIIFKVVLNEYDVDKIKLNDIIQLYKKYGSILECNLTHKILDIKKQNIIGVVTQHNRVIPVKKELNNASIKLPESIMNYYNDVDEVLTTKIDKLDDRILLMNRKYYEDETFIRMKFELAKYLKKNKEDDSKILEILNENDIKRDIIKSREIMGKILKKIFDLLTTKISPNIDYNQYITPNKRLPCSSRSLSANRDDPHCSVNNKSCKLFVNPINLITNNKNNYQHYIAKIVDELLRFKLKRNEIINDTIPIIINKELIREQYDKYILIHTNNMNELVNIVDNLYKDDIDIYLDNRKLYELSKTTEYGFKKERYIKSNKLLFKNYNSESLPLKWNKLLTNNFNIRMSQNQNLFELINIILNIDEMRQYRVVANDFYDIKLLKKRIVDHINSEIKQNNNANSKNILDFYKKYGNSLKSFQYVTSIFNLIELINTDTYNGTLADLEYISKIFKLNIVVLEDRSRKGEEDFRFMHIDNYESNYFILLIRTKVLSTYSYNIIDNKNKILFKIEELPTKFIDYIAK